MSVKSSANAYVQFKPTAGGSYLTVGRLRDVRLDIRRDALETTGIGELDRNYRYGIRGTSGSATLLYDPENVAAVDMMSRILEDTEDLSDIKIVFDNTSADGTLSGAALITAANPGVSVGDLVTVPITFTISNKPFGSF